MSVRSALCLILRGHTPYRARKGLFAGKQIGFGTKYSKEYEKPSSRTWKPNVVKTKLYSEALDQRIPLTVTTAAIRAIDQAGGLDQYLMRTPDRMLQSDVGSALKWRIGLTYRQRAWEARQQQRQQQQAAASSSSRGAAVLLEGADAGPSAADGTSAAASAATPENSSAGGSTAHKPVSVGGPPDSARSM